MRKHCFFLYVLISIPVIFFVPISILYITSSVIQTPVLWCPLRLYHVLFVLSSICFSEGPWLTCVCLCTMVSNTYCLVLFVLFVFVLRGLCCQFLWIVQFFISPSVLSYVYLHTYSVFLFIYIALVNLKVTISLCVMYNNNVCVFALSLLFCLFTICYNMPIIVKSVRQIFFSKV